MTLAVLALFADGPSRLDQHRQLARQGDRSPRGDGRRAAQARRHRRRGRRLPRDHAARAPGAPRTIETYDDHRMAMAMSLAAFNGAADPAPPLPVRILDPRCVAKTWPDYFEALFVGRRGGAAARSRCSPSTARPPPARARWRAPSPPRSATCCSTPARVYRADRDRRARRPASMPTTRPPSRRSPARMDLRFDGRPHLPRRRRRQRLAAPRGSRRARLAHLGAARACAAPCSACRPRFAACPAWSPTGATWAPSSSPTPTLKVFLTASAARARRAPVQAIDFKGDFR